MRKAAQVRCDATRSICRPRVKENPDQEIHRKCRKAIINIEAAPKKKAAETETFKSAKLPQLSLPEIKLPDPARQSATISTQTAEDCSMIYLMSSLARDSFRVVSF